MTGYRREGGYGRGGSSFGGPKPVEVDKEYEVRISEVSRRGDGIARIQGFVIFVEGAKVEEHVKIKVIDVGNRFAKAQIVSRSVEGEEKKGKAD
ncbi:MAG: TRAM domain-containing protein [Nitrososphaerales archaeon]|nr:TRAM domain-containing protein [Nitrososphaerales archaeon]